MSSDVHQIRRQVEDLKRELENLEDRVKRLSDRLTQTYDVLNAGATLMRRMGLPENVSQAISLVQRFTTTLRMLRTSMLAAQAAAGPVGWVSFAISMGATMVTLGDVAAEVHGH